MLPTTHAQNGFVSAFIFSAAVIPYCRGLQGTEGVPGCCTGRIASPFRMTDNEDVRIRALLKMFDEHDVAVLLFDLGEKEPMLVRRNR